MPDTKGDQGAKAEEGDGRAADADRPAQEDGKWHMVSRTPHDTGGATASEDESAQQGAPPAEQGSEVVEGESAQETAPDAEGDRSEQPETSEKQPGQQTEPPVDSAEPEQSADVATDDESGHERTDGGASATGRSGGAESPGEERGEAKREQAPAGPGAAASALALVGRIIAGVFALLAAIIIVAILLKVTGANRLNPMVSVLLPTGSFLVGPFEQVFQLDGRNTEVVVNWGIAAALYLVVGQVVGRALGAVGRRPAS